MAQDIWGGGKERKRERERERERERKLLITDITYQASCLGLAEASCLTPQTVPNSALEKCQRVLRKTSRAISNDCRGVSEGPWRKVRVCVGYRRSCCFIFIITSKDEQCNIQQCKYFKRGWVINRLEIKFGLICLDNVKKKKRKEKRKSWKSIFPLTRVNMVAYSSLSALSSCFL